MKRKKETTPAQVINVIALREAGYSHIAIAQRLNLSVRTVQRHLSTNKVIKGSLKAEVIERAKSEMIALVTSSSAIKEEAAKLVLDDIAHSNHLRDLTLAASEHLKATNAKEAVLVMRGAAAYSTVLKNTSDTVRHSLGVDKVEEDEGELPELILREITEEEAKAITLSGMVEDSLDMPDVPKDDE